VLGGACGRPDGGRRDGGLPAALLLPAGGPARRRTRNPQVCRGRSVIDPMSARIEYEVVAPESTKGLTELARFVRSGTLPAPLVELVKVRASQINGCAYCLDVHYRRARRAGVPQPQLDMLAGWTNSPVFSEKERAALSWTESLTQVSLDHVPDSAWDRVKAQFSEREIVDLSIAIVEINSWNRLMIAFRTPPAFGTQQKSSPGASTPLVGVPAATPNERPASSS